MTEEKYEELKKNVVSCWFKISFPNKYDYENYELIYNHYDNEPLEDSKYPKQKGDFDSQLQWKKEIWFKKLGTIIDNKLVVFNEEMNTKNEELKEFESKYLQNNSDFYYLGLLSRNHQAILDMKNKIKKY